MGARTMPATTAVPALQNVATEKRRESCDIGSRRASASLISHDSNDVYRIESAHTHTRARVAR